MLAVTLALPLAAADVTVYVTDPTTGQLVLGKTIGTNAATCYESIGNATYSPIPNCGLLF